MNLSELAHLTSAILVSFMVGPVLAASKNSVFCASADRATLYVLFISFFLFHRMKNTMIHTII